MIIVKLTRYQGSHQKSRIKSLLRVAATIIINILHHYLPTSLKRCQITLQGVKPRCNLRLHSIATMADSAKQITQAEKETASPAETQNTYGNVVGCVFRVRWLPIRWLMLCRSRARTMDRQEGTRISVRLSIEIVGRMGSRSREMRKMVGRKRSRTDGGVLKWYMLFAFSEGKCLLEGGSQKQ